MNKRLIALLLAFFVWRAFVHPFAGIGGERENLREQEKTLERRIETLRREQDFLTFQTTMYSSDSKYLVLNLSKKAGQLRYKNRVLKDFRFLIDRNQIKSLKQGPVSLTRKIESSGQRRALVFGKTAILRPKPSAVSQDTAVPHLVLVKKDFASVFSALENGALAYILH